MSGWNCVDVDFGEETANFGPRKESGSSLYQVETTATITHNGQVTQNPHVCGVAGDDGTVIAAGSHISFFADSCRRFLVTQDVGAEIDVLTMSEDGHFLVTGDRSGCIMFFYYDSQMRIFSKKLVDNANSNSQIFHHLAFSQMSDDGLVDLLIVSSKQVDLLTKLDLKALSGALATGNLQRAHSIQTQLEFKVINTGTRHSERTLYALPGHELFDFITMGCGDSALCVWEKINEELLPVKSMASSVLGGVGIKKAVATSCGNLLCLDLQGRLNVINLQLLVVMKQMNQHAITNFNILEDGDENHNIRDLKLLLLTTRADHKTGFEICRLSDMTTVYSLILEPWTYLVQTSTVQESIFVVEGAPDEMESSSLVATLRIRCLTEAQPETRLYRLIHKGNFEEAETFARMFKQDMELVYKAKCNYLLNLLSPWNVHKIQSEKISEYTKMVRSCMDQILDDEHVANCCTSAAMPTFQAVFELLMFSKQRLCKRASSSGCQKSNTGELLTKTMEMLYRLETFQMAYGEENFSGQAWSDFLRASMLREVMSQFQVHHIHSAIIIWNRHQGEFAKDFTTDKLSDLLSCIPEQTPSGQLKVWLTEDLIPYIIRKSAHGLPILAGWIEQRARNMEIFEKDNWPANSLEFCEILQNTCISVSHFTYESGLSTPEEIATQIVNMSGGYFHCKNRHSEKSDDSDVFEQQIDAFQSLSTLIYQLSELLRLHTKYRCKLSLAEFVLETTESLTYRMLDRVAAIELIPSAIEKFVRPYMREHKLNEDQILFQYIADLAKRSVGHMKSCLGHTHWENKAIAVIGCINDTNYKLQGIHDAMKRAYVPWSPNMEKLVQDGLAAKHPKVAILEELYALTELKKMLIHYDLKKYDDYLKGGKKCAEQLVHYILQQDRPTALKDALHLVQKFNTCTESDVYFYQVLFFIERDRLDEALTLLKSLSVDRSMEFGFRLLNHTTVVLNNQLSFSDEDEKMQKETKLILTGATCQILKHLLSLTLDTVDRDELQSSLNNLQTISALQIEFGVFLGYHEIDGAYLREELFQNFLTRFLRSDPTLNEILPFQSRSERRTSCKKTFNFSKLLRLGCILGIGESELRGHLAIEAAKKGHLDLSFQYAKQLFDDLPSHSVVQTLYQISVEICYHLADDSKKDTSVPANIHDDIYNIAKLALTHCSPEMTRDCLKLCNCLALAGDVLRNCESGNYGSSVQVVEDDAHWSSKDPYREWCNDSYFHEEGLVMDSITAIPLVYHNVINCLTSTESNLQTRLQSMYKSSSAVCEYLSPNGHSELALAYKHYLLGCLINNLHLLNTADCKSQTSPVFLGDVDKLTQSCKEAAVIIMKKAMNKSRIDHHLILGYLADFDKRNAFEMLTKMFKTVAHQYKKGLALGRLGIDLAMLTDEAKILKMWQDYALNCEWGLKFSKLKIPCKDVFKGDKNSKRMLIPMLVSSKNVKISLIQDFCSAYNLAPEDAILMYLECVLLPASDNKTEEVIVADTSFTVYQRITAEEAIAKLRGLDVVVNTLQSVLNKIDAYDYERILFVLSALNEMAPTEETENRLQLVQELSIYRRVAPPSDYEINYIPITEDEEAIHGSKKLSPLSVSRLPFHPLLHGEPWKILSPELNADTIDLLWPIAELLKLSSSTLYMVTIRNIVTAYIRVKNFDAGTEIDPSTLDKSKCNWTLDKDTEEHFFPTVMSLLFRLPLVENAAVTCSWIMKQFPIGAEKVVALKACVDFCERWAAACTDDQQAEREKAKTLYNRYFAWHKRLSIEQVLLQNNLGDKELLALSNSSVRLIFKLYEHQSILERFKPRVVIDSLPDIHKATNLIGQIGNVEICQIRLNLIEKWLPSIQQDDVDMTLNMTNMILDSTMRGEDEEIEQDEINLKRVIYLLQHEVPKSSVLFLLSYMHESDSPKITNLCRVRALRCLFSLADNSSIQKLMKSPIDFLSQLEQLIYMVKLDKLRMPQTMTSFTSCNKEGLVRGIWMNHSHDTQAVRLVADLCLDYHINDVQLWNSVLQQLQAFQMNDCLRHIMLRLSYNPELWKVAAYHRTWTKLILMPLTTASTPLNKEQLQDCFNAYLLVFRCPLIHTLDLTMLAKHFYDVGLPACTLGCLLLIVEPEARDAKIKAILEEEGQICLILAQLKEWSTSNWIVSMMIQIEHAVYNEIETTQSYYLLNGTGYERKFSDYLIARNQIDGLFICCIKDGRMLEAAVLLRLYQHIYKDGDFAKAIIDVRTDEQLIRKYIELKDLSNLEEYLPEQTEDSTESEDEI